jgi:diaminopimelate decarboxylase
MPAPREVYRRIAELPNVEAVGVDMHIGSQIVDLEPFGNAFSLMAELVRDLRADGHHIEHVDVGGGLGIPYDHNQEAPPHPQAYAAVVRDRVGQLGCSLVIEPGRLLVGNARHPAHQGGISQARRHQLSSSSMPA